MSNGRVRRRWVTALLAAVGVMALLAAGTSAASGSGPETEIAGTVHESHGDDFATLREVNQQLTLDTASGPVRFTLPSGAKLHPGQQASLRGHFVGKNFQVAAGGVTAGPGGGHSHTEGAAAAAATGTKNIAVLMLNFSNNAAQPWTNAAVRNVVFDGSSSVNAYYQDASDGQLNLTGDVYGWYTIAADNSGCAYSTWGSQANNAATAAGVNLSAYQYVVYAFPSASSCGWAGLAYLPGSQSYINGSMTLRVVAHELGHNFGVHHASSESCTNGGVRVTLSSTCTSDEYGDPFTVMGSASTRLHHNWHRSQLGYSNTVQTVTTSGDYQLSPADSSTGSTRLLRIPRSDGTYYQLEFRQPTGLFDTFTLTDPAVLGVTIRIAPNPTTIVQSQLLDTTPATTTFSDAPLAAGRTFVDPFTGMQITTKAVSSLGATVGIQFAPDGQAPSVPASLTATAKSASSIALGWTASTDNVGVAGYRVLRGGVQIATTTATAFTDSGLASGTPYTYQVLAFDAANNVSAPAQASATTWVLDTQAPSAPTGLKATINKGGQVALTWTKSTDNVAVVGYRILRSGAQVGTVTGTTTTDKPRKGSYTYTVVAYDTAGNVSAASNPVTVKV